MVRSLHHDFLGSADLPMQLERIEYLAWCRPTTVLIRRIRQSVNKLCEMGERL